MAPFTPTALTRAQHELVFEHFLTVIVQATTVHRLLITALDLSVLTEDADMPQSNSSKSI